VIKPAQTPKLVAGRRRSLGRRAIGAKLLKRNIRKPFGQELQVGGKPAETLGALEVPLALQKLAATGVTSFSIELMPRTTRAQSMDALSSMATICGYKAVVIAADTLPRLFPMLTTAAGTITPARVFVIGAGVAGLQAIATARRLGAVASAYDLQGRATTALR